MRAIITIFLLILTLFSHAQKVDTLGGERGSITIIPADTLVEKMKKGSVLVRNAVINDDWVKLIKVKLPGNYRFEHVQIASIFWVNACEFIERPTFYDCIFKNQVNLDLTIFHRGISFTKCVFEGKFQSYESDFLYRAQFLNDTFKGYTVFNRANFQNLDLYGAVFEQYTSFGYAQFGRSPQLRFIQAKEISFSGTTGMINFVIPWFDEEFNGQTRKGLKNYIIYDRTFFLSLEKNFRDLGMDEEADDIHLRYRVEERRKKIREWKTFPEGVLELIFLEIPFGYGVRPLRILGVTSLIVLLTMIIFVFNTTTKRTSFIKRLFYNLYASVDHFLPGSPLASEKYVTVNENIWIALYLLLLQALAWYLLLLIPFMKVWS